ncbi:MAG: excinuclease ABC subunit UvrC [Oscillospiraceae bacterium]|nr:excinuclease ABC subunit UvrC [Oscillospiraceae bacterium]
MENLREKSLALPQLPGVYIMMDKSGKVIYVGKAKQLKNRVGSYFSGVHDIKTYALVEKIADFDVIIANSEFEALVLENSLIKHHMPKYNIRLRDDKGYQFIRVDLKQEYPVFTIARKQEKDGALYLGPYGNRSVTREAIETVCKALQIPTCGKDFAKIAGKERPCLHYHIGACRAYCQKGATAAEYRESIEAAVDIFHGKTAALIEKFTKEMDEAAENLSFELAAEKRDRLRAVQLLEQKQLVIAGSMADTDVAGFFRGPVKSCFTVLHYVDGNLISKDFELFDTPLEDDPDAMSGIVRQYYEKRGVLPKTICLPFATPDSELLEKLFTEIAGRRVTILIPQRGDKLKLVETANINAREETERVSTKEEKALKTLEWLQNALKLPNLSARIEAYDVSNTGASDIVASMTVFVRGRPYKKDYRRFKIKSVQRPDDYSSMKEVIQRRMARHSEADSKFAELPDLLLVDGGATHAAAVRAELIAAGVDLPVFGMVKDSKHKTRALMSPDGEEIGITGNPAAFALIGTIQEETHRFAVEYHRTLRSKNTIKSKLDEIEGVGEKRRNDLLKSFGSLKAISKADVEELSKVVPKNVAEKIYGHFNNEKGDTL